MAFKMNKNKPGSLYKKIAGKNSTSFSMLEKSSMKAAKKSSMTKPTSMKAAEKSSMAKPKSSMTKPSTMKAAEMSSMKDVDKVVVKGDPEFEGIKAAKDKIDATARSVNTPGVVVSGETLASARERVKQTKDAYQDSGSYSSEDRARYLKMGLKPGKEMANQKRKENEMAKMQRTTGQN